MLLSDSHISYAGITLLNISFEGIFFLRFKELPILCYECLGYDFNIRVYLILYCCAVFILYTSGNLGLKFFVQYCVC
jgi:hypothetical protein